MHHTAEGGWGVAAPPPPPPASAPSSPALLLKVTPEQPREEDTWGWEKNDQRRCVAGPAF